MKINDTAQGFPKQNRRCCQRRSGATTRVSQRVLVHRDRLTSTGTGGSDPLWHSWRGTPARDRWKTLRRIRRRPLIYRKRGKGKASRLKRFIPKARRATTPDRPRFASRTSSRGLTRSRLVVAVSPNATRKPLSLRRAF